MMKHYSIREGLLFIAAMILAACAPHPETVSQPVTESKFDAESEKEAIRKGFREITLAFNNHDATKVAAMMDKDFESWSGTPRGRTAVKKGLTEEFANQSDIQFNLVEEIGIVFLTQETAILKYRAEYTGMLDGEGKPLPPVKTLSADIVVKKDGKWVETAYFERPIEGR